VNKVGCAILARRRQRLNAALRTDEFIDHSTAGVGEAPVSILNERYPCQNCACASYCAAGLLACAAFERYVYRRPWRSADRAPTAERWRAIFVSGKPTRAVRASRAVAALGESLGAAARSLGVSYNTLKTWIRLGAPVVRVRPTLRGARVDVAAVAEWQARHLAHYRRRSSTPSTEPRRVQKRLATQRWRARQRAQLVSGKRDQLPGDTA
jgi:hypothetical protein